MNLKIPLLPALFFFALAVAFYKIWWLAAGLLIAGLIISFMKWKKTLLEKARIYYALIFFLVFTFSIIIRVFVLEIYSIPSSSMENTLFPGDKIIVSKLKYGPKMPGSPFEIPWINLFFFLNAHAREHMDEPWWNGKRLKGTGSVQRGDVVVFKFPDNKTLHFIKRCVALPGDTLLIKNSRIFINKQPVPDAAGVRHRYDIFAANRKKAITLMDSLGISFYPSFDRRNGIAEASLSRSRAQWLNRLPFIDSVTVKLPPPDISVPVFPFDDRFSWTAENFGPVTIPARGMRIVLDNDNFGLYRKIIYQFDGDTLRAAEIEKHIQSNDSAVYVFNKNFYFMMGDNRYGSHDSRFWGPVPEDYIIGNAVLVLFSTNNDNFLSRFLKKIK